MVKGEENGQPVRKMEEMDGRKDEDTEKRRRKKREETVSQ